jgi:hypothetical protein
LEKDIEELREEVKGMKDFRRRVGKLKSTLINNNKEWKDFG